MKPHPQHSALLLFLLLGLAPQGSPRTITSTGQSQSRSIDIQLDELCTIGTGIHGEDDLLATPVAVALVGDSILVLDSKPGGYARLAVFGLDGRPIGTIGGIGDGPGEYRQPWALAVDDRNGKIYIREAAGGRIHVYSRAGLYEETIRLPVGGLQADHTPMMQVIESGLLFFLRYEFRMAEGSDQRFVRQPVYYILKQDGSIVDTLRVPIPSEDPYQLIAQSQSTGGLRIGRVPFAPTYHWAITSSGALAHGYSDTYLIRVDANAREPMTIRRDIPPIGVDSKERAWYRQFQLLSLRIGQDDWKWNGPTVPRTKPFFQAFYPSRDGRLWVLREGKGQLIDGCASRAETIHEMMDNPCWLSTWTFEVFDEMTGQLLGVVSAPEGFREFPAPFIYSDTFICAVDDESGAQFVKVYRIHYPGIGSE